jgi:hypothetical protein
MKTKRKVQSKRLRAQVISLAAYREARRGPVPAPVSAQVVDARACLVEAYCQWLALVGAAWACWW